MLKGYMLAFEMLKGYMLICRMLKGYMVRERLGAPVLTLERKKHELVKTLKSMKFKTLSRKTFGYRLKIKCFWKCCFFFIYSVAKHLHGLIIM